MGWRGRKEWMGWRGRSRVEEERGRGYKGLFIFIMDK